MRNIKFTSKFVDIPDLNNKNEFIQTTVLIIQITYIMLSLTHVKLFK